MTQTENRPQAENAATDGTYLALRVESLWKIFGPRADKIIGTPDADLSRADLKRKTGCVVGVREVSFEVGGVDVTNASEGQLRDLRRHHVSMVFQHFGLLPNRQVIDNVAYGLEVRG